jgi:hypothetical protein
MKTMTNIKDVLKRLDIQETGSYKDHFYVIPLANSNEYAKMYTKLDKKAINTEYPEFAKNTNEATTKITNYFEIEEDNVLYDIFLFADFNEDKYYLKITERAN